MALRTDEIGFGGLKLIQDTEAFCYGVDAVLLADFAQASDGQTIMDMCTGNGVVPLILSALCKAEKIYGVEFQPAAAQIARNSVQLNQLEELIEIIESDVLRLNESLKEGCLDLVTCNPPYTEKGRGMANPTTALQLARHESTASLDDFIRIAASLLKPRGRLCMVHRPSRLTDLMCIGRKYSMEPKRLRMVAPSENQPANIVLIEFVKGAGRELTMLPQLVVRNEDGSFTDEIDRIYKREK